MSGDTEDTNVNKKSYLDVGELGAERILLIIAGKLRVDAVNLVTELVN